MVDLTYNDVATGDRYDIQKLKNRVRVWKNRSKLVASNMAEVKALDDADLIEIIEKLK